MIVQVRLSITTGTNNGAKNNTSDNSRNTTSNNNDNNNNVNDDSNDNNTDKNNNIKNNHHDNSSIYKNNGCGIISVTIAILSFVICIVASLVRLLGQARVLQAKRVAFVPP